MGSDHQIVEGRFVSESASSSSTVVETLQLDVHPSVVFKLGADLITDDMQALMELIKNSYDADATRVRVSIDTHARFDRLSGELLDNPEAGSSDESDEEQDELVGAITIIDDGNPEFTCSVDDLAAHLKALVPGAPEEVLAACDDLQEAIEHNLPGIRETARFLDVTIIDIER